MKQDRFLTDKIAPTLIKFAIPLMFALILQALYGAVDLWVVGKYADTACVAAVATGSQIMQVFTCIITGITIGVTVLISNAVGENNHDKASEVMSGQIKLFIVMSIVMSIGAIAFAPQIATIMNAPEKAFDGTVDYLRICSAGMIFIFAYNGISGIFRGIGNSKSPLMFVAIACVCNIILDIAFVKYFSMQASGAALATIIAQALSVVFSLIHIKRKPLPFRFKGFMLKQNSAILSILKVGLPIAIQDFLTGVSFLIISSLVNSMGVVASAAIGVMNKMFVFIALIPMSFMSALASFVGQNFGAKKYDRVNKSLFVALRFSLAAGLCMFALTHYAGEFVTSFFNNDPEVIKACASYLNYESFEYIIISIMFCFLGYFNGLGKTSFVMFQGLFATFVLRIPISFYISQLPNTNVGLFGLAAPLSAISALILCVIYMVYLKKTMFKKLESELAIKNN